jgi:potassium-dependent mechanosensitive channel
LNFNENLIDLPLFTLDQSQVTIGGLLAVLAVLLATYVATQITDRAINRYLKRHSRGAAEVPGVYATIIKVIIWFVGIEIALKILGIQLMTLLTAGGFLALGAGFAVKNVVENFLSGGIIRAEKTVNCGDVIIVEGQWMAVQHLGIRTVEAITLDGENVLIPNSTVAESIVQNLTYHDRTCRLRVDVGVAYESDLKLVRKTLENTVRQLKWKSEHQKPVVYLHEFGDSAVQYVVHVWIDEADHGRQAKSDLHEAIWWGLKDANITIAFPQLDVHLNEVNQAPASETQS